MIDLVIRNGRVVDPGRRIDLLGDVLIKERQIEDILPCGIFEVRRDDSAVTVIDATGCVVCPGFVDLHAHLREPGFEEKETIETGTRAAAAGGFTTVCCMPNTNPPIDNPATLDYVRRISEIKGLVRVLPIATITKGRGGRELSEMGDLARAGAVGFSDDGRPVSDARIMRYALEYSRMVDKPVIAHCEELDLSRNGVMNEGPVATKLGLAGIPAAAEEIAVARDITLAKAFGGRLHIAHVSTAGAVELIRRAKQNGVNVTAEVTPHHLTLTEDWVAGGREDWLAVDGNGLERLPYDANTKVNPPLRSLKDVRALIEGLRDGTIDAIATDHAPHTVVDKQCEYGLAEFGISGLETALSLVLTLVHRNEIDIGLLVEKLTSGPAKVLDLPLGTIKPGAPADIVVFDPDRFWTVDPTQFASKGQNTPLAGLRLLGKVVCTLVAGRIVFADDEWKKRGTKEDALRFGLLHG